MFKTNEISYFLSILSKTVFKDLSQPYTNFRTKVPSTSQLNTHLDSFT